MPEITPPFDPHWPEGLKTKTAYRVPCDDNGRDGQCWLQVMFGPDGDAHVSMQDWRRFPAGDPSPCPSVRNRTFVGGGRNIRTHQALIWLAEAIRLDAEDHDGA